MQSVPADFQQDSSWTEADEYRFAEDPRSFATLEGAWQFVASTEHSAENGRPLDLGSYQLIEKFTTILKIAYEPVARARDQLLSIHTEGSRSRDILPQQSLALERSLQDLSTCVQTLTGRDVSVDDIALFEQSRNKFLKDKTYLLEEVHSIGDVEDKLRKAEFAVAAEEAYFVSQLQEITSQLPKNQKLEDPGSKSAIARKHDDISSHTHIVLQPYYNAIADVHIAEERLMELETSYLCELEARKTAFSEQHSLPTTTPDFTLHYERKRQEAENDLKDANRQAVKAKLECVAEGIIAEQGEPVSLSSNNLEAELLAGQPSSVQDSRRNTCSVPNRHSGLGVTKTYDVGVTDIPADRYQGGHGYGFERLHRIGDSIWANSVRKFWSEIKSIDP